MKILIFDKELELHYSFRMMYLYEQIKEKSLDVRNMTSEDLLILFYAAVLATLQYNHVTQPLSYVEFMNWIDDHGGENAILDFSKWFVDTMTAQIELMPEQKDDSKTTEEDDSKNA